MARIKQTSKGWVSVTQLPNGDWQTSLFLESRANPTQLTSKKKSIAIRKAKLLAKRNL